MNKELVYVSGHQPVDRDQLVNPGDSETRSEAGGGPSPGLIFTIKRSETTDVELLSGTAPLFLRLVSAKHLVKQGSPHAPRGQFAQQHYRGPHRIQVVSLRGTDGRGIHVLNTAEEIGPVYIVSTGRMHAFPLWMLEIQVITAIGFGPS